MSLSRPTLRAPDSGASQPLFLSLFLLLLALFILLNAISAIEPGRSDRVLDSVQRAFPSAYRAEIGDGVGVAATEIIGEVGAPAKDGAQAPVKMPIGRIIG